MHNKCQTNQWFLFVLLRILKRFFNNSSKDECLSKGVCLLYYVPGSVQAAGGAAVNKTQRFPLLTK